LGFRELFHGDREKFGQVGVMCFVRFAQVRIDNQVGVARVRLAFWDPELLQPLVMTSKIDCTSRESVASFPSMAATRSWQIELSILPDSAASLRWYFMGDRATVAYAR
jgi:hypothetical protein